MTSVADRATLDFYDWEATRYAERAEDYAARAPLERFAAMLPPGGDVLDFGCGPGWAGAALVRRGFRAVGLDASPGLAAEARRRYGLGVTVGPFGSLEAQAAYDGIWASFCLLHDRREAMPGHLDRLSRALRPGGALYLGLKEGEGSERDRLGRLYTYFTESEMRGLLHHAGFRSVSVDREPDTGYDGTPCTALHIFCRRA